VGKETVVAQEYGSNVGYEDNPKYPFLANDSQDQEELPLIVISPDMMKETTLWTRITRFFRG
jgi:hypothetical protein